MSLITLAIETSSKFGSAALLRDELVVAEHDLDPLVGSARTLAPAMQQLLADQNLRPQQVNLIAVSTGPGSFTGLRVGITTAKTLAFALRCNLIGVDTLDAIAEQFAGVIVPPVVTQLHAVIDAQRRELFLARFERATATDAAMCWKRTAETQIVPAETWLRELTGDTAVTGPALQRLLPGLRPSTVASPADCWRPQAATIGLLGLVAWRSGRRDDLYQLMPTYLRPSYADEKARP
jgi:tRNA threonylcarbamoyladenosine biosynthesis protein TsaB